MCVAQRLQRVAGSARYDGRRLLVDATASIERFGEACDGGFDALGVPAALRVTSDISDEAVAQLG